MSDKEAEKKTTEEDESKKKLEEAQKKLWVVQLVRDPDQGTTVVMPGQNVKKQWQLDMMLHQAVEQQQLTKSSRSIVELLKAMGVVKEGKKGLFRGK